MRRARRIPGYASRSKDVPDMGRFATLALLKSQKQHIVITGKKRFYKNSTHFFPVYCVVSNMLKIDTDVYNTNDKNCLLPDLLVTLAVVYPSRPDPPVQRCCNIMFNRNQS